MIKIKELLFAIIWTIVFGISVHLVLAEFFVNKAESSAQRVVRIYNRLVPQTGLRQMIPPIMVVNLPIVNAYNTNKIIVIYQGIIDACKNDDELALIIGHEMAHSTLMHFDLPYGENNNYTAILESNADKLGSYYIMRAGYDVCKGRKFWKQMIEDEGDYVGADHPSLAYRYEQLDVGCE